VTDQWSVLANFTYQDSVITGDPQDTSAAFVNGNAFAGNHPQGVPKYFANLWTTYKFSIAGVPGFIVGAGLNYRDKVYSDTTNVNSIPAYVIGNAMLGYEADNWGATLNVKNFTNQRYYIEANAAGATVGDSLSAFLKVYVKY
jgi:iron complex outermembrane receptor protein